MDDFSSGDLIRRMEKVLKRAIKNVLENMDPDHQDFKRELVKSVNKKMRVLTSQLSFHYTPFSTIAINNFSYTPGRCNEEGVMIGELVATYTQKPDHTKYGGPGYPGKENGQLCEHPKGSKKFYKWNAFLCRWEDVYKDIPRTSQEPDWYDKLTNNAAFEPWWGNNTSGGNYLRSDRKRNGADNLWGDPGVGSRMGTFKQISGNVMQSIYRFTLNLKSAIGHYEKLSNAFGFENEIEEKSEKKRKSGEEDTITHILRADNFEIKTKKQANGFISEIKGYKNAQRDSAYHVNQARLQGDIRIEITIKKKYE
ncbi:hypothetical protein ACFSTE_15230 [Aquimarina hainanensis]|uniref:Uncharacterized protein n=1 Tax=Aquimarina hainanensis TaxID=1578017 RepID=A0ABW5NB30_9FLAO